MITSTDNPRIKALAKLKTARERRRTGQFLIEGGREVERATAAGITVEALLICRELPGAIDPIDVTAEIIEVAPGPMRKVAMRENPPGVIALARQFDTALSRFVPGPKSLYLIAEQVEKPGNLGAMLRTCDATGADGLVVADAATDVFNPNVVRASQGALFSVPVAVAGTRDAIDWSRQGGLQVVGGYPDAAAPLWDVTLRGPTAILVGAEDVGISAAWREVAVPARIPMSGQADSLNASVAAALLLYEAVRQRTDRPLPAGKDEPVAESA
ncbi:MAG: RNA methyltransferase [Acidimicrobiia bacterium]|nr:RNA methyltransferase [Acidimicrobiia bacterium]